MAVLSVTFVACDDNEMPNMGNDNPATKQDKDDDNVVVEKKSLIQQRNEVFEAEGKTKWYDYEGKEYSFGKLSFATSFTDPCCISYSWEDLKGYDTRFNEEITIKIVDKIEQEIYSQYGLTDTDKSDREALISFYDISYYTEFSNEVDHRRKVYENHLKSYPDEPSFENMCRKSTIDIDRYEDDRVIINKGTYVYLDDDDVIYIFEPHFLWWYLDSQDFGRIGYEYTELGVKAQMHTLIRDKETGQTFLCIMHVDIPKDYVKAVQESDAYAEDKESVIVAEQQKFAEILQPYLDEVVNGYLLEEFGVEMGA